MCFDEKNFITKARTFKFKLTKRKQKKLRLAEYRTNLEP